MIAFDCADCALVSFCHTLISQLHLLCILAHSCHGISGSACVGLRSMLCMVCMVCMVGTCYWLVVVCVYANL